MEDAATNPHGISSSRLRLLREVMSRREAGATAEELAAALGVSRTAVTQQLAALTREAMVEPIGTRSTGGRPSRTYALTERGRGVFPRRYALLATSLLRHAQARFGDEGLAQLVDGMAQELAEQAAPRLEGKAGHERRREVVQLLNELGYEARMADSGAIEASNCVFSDVARSHPGACRFDVTLLGALLGDDVEHATCMLEGHACCRFRPT